MCHYGATLHDSHARERPCHNNEKQSKYRDPKFSLQTNVPLDGHRLVLDSARAAQLTTEGSRFILIIAQTK
jgi:hypothetical protein